MRFADQFDAFHDAASKATGLTDFGPDNYVEPLRLLLLDYDAHARFNALGVEMIKGEVIGKLVGRLMTTQGLKQNPAARNTPVRAPIIIYGMPRTGSTALHRLIAQDPGTQSLPMWLGCTPVPRPPRETWPSNSLFRAAAAALEQMYALDPQLRSLHPMEADQPDECRFALDHSFWSPDVTSCATIPDYTRWVFECDARYAFRYYKQVLNIIADGNPARWVLKDVDHLFGLDSLISEFPDALLIQTHRDPIIALTSVASLIFRLRQLREPDLDSIDHGKLILKTWGAALNKAEQVRQSAPAANVIDVHNDDLHADATGTVEKIYRHFGLTISDEARSAWSRRIKADPYAGHGVHKYQPADFGFTRTTVESAAPDYCARHQSIDRHASKRTPPK